MARLRFIGRILKSCISPFMRPFILASSLVMLSLSVLFLAQILGFKYTSAEASRESRKVVVEALAVQLSSLATRGSLDEIHATVSRFVLRTSDIHAASLVRNNGVVLAELGDTTLIDTTASGSTSTQLRVPIYEESQLWGEVRVVFAPAKNRWQEIKSYVFVACCSLFLFTAFLNRALIQLDPRGVVPGRVDSAMNLFSAGVLVLDAKLRIVMANESAAGIANRDALS